MSELKACPFCGCPNWSPSGENNFRCPYCDAIVGISFVQARPVEDALQRRMDELSHKLELCEHVAKIMTELHDQRVKRIDELTAELSALREQVRWIPTNNYVSLADRRTKEQRDCAEEEE